MEGIQTAKLVSGVELIKNPEIITIKVMQKSYINQLPLLESFVDLQVIGQSELFVIAVQGSKIKRCQQTSMRAYLHEQFQKEGLEDVRGAVDKAMDAIPQIFIDD